MRSPQRGQSCEFNLPDGGPVVGGRCGLITGVHPRWNTIKELEGREAILKSTTAVPIQGSGKEQVPVVDVILLENLLLE